MPHKRNPVACEQISGLARVIRSNLQAALENIALWHERDISHSSVERMILPSSFILTDHILRKMTQIVDNLIVYPERMRENLESMKGLVFSGQVLLELAKRGLSREEAYRIVQRNAMAVWSGQEDFKSLLEKDPGIKEKALAGRAERNVRLRKPDATSRHDLSASVRVLKDFHAKDLCSPQTLGARPPGRNHPRCPGHHGLFRRRGSSAGQVLRDVGKGRNSRRRGGYGSRDREPCASNPVIETFRVDIVD